MSSKFDIRILSRLEIDTASSAREINKTINSDQFQKSLESMKIKVEAGLDKANAGKLRKSVRDLIKLAKSEKTKGLTFSVEVDIDQDKAIKNINTSLKEAAKRLKSIKIDIDARVDDKTLRDQLNNVKQSQPETQQPTQGNVPKARVDREKQIEQTLKSQLITSKALTAENTKIFSHSMKINAEQAKTTQNGHKIAGSMVTLRTHYKDLKEFSGHLSGQLRTMDKNMQPVISSTIQLDDNMEKAVVKASMFNKELQRIQTHTFTAKTDSLYRLVPDTVSTVNSEGSVDIESRNRAVALLEREIQANKERIAQSTSVESTLRRQNKEYEALVISQTSSHKAAKALVDQNKITVMEHNAEVKAVQRKKDALNQYTKAMQQNKRHIDKGAMKNLRQQIVAVDTSTSGANAKLTQMQSTMRGYVNQAAQATRSQMGLLENFNNAMVKFPIWMGASTLFFGVIRSSRAFIDNIIEIDSRMITLQKVMSNSANMEAVFNDAQKAAERFGQTIKDVLDAYAEFARQGYEDVDLSNFGNAALIASNVGEISSQEASEFLTAAAAQWQTGSEEAMRQVDAWNEIANNYATTVEKLGEGHAKSGATAKAMGLDFHETNAILGALTAQTKQSGSEIGNFIKSAFPRIYAGAGRKVLEDLNVDIETMNGETKSAITLLREVSFAMDDLSTSDRADAVRGLGGVWHYQRMEVLLETLRDTQGMYDQMEQSSRNSFGSAAAENAVYMESLEARVNKARVAIEQLSLAFGEAFLESGIIEAVETFTSMLQGLVSVMSDFGGVVRNLAFGAMIAGITQVSSSMRNLRASIGKAAFDPIVANFTRLRNQMVLLKKGYPIEEAKRFATSMKRVEVSSMSSIRTTAVKAKSYKGLTVDKNRLRSSLHALDASQKANIVTTNRQIATKRRFAGVMVSLSGVMRGFGLAVRGMLSLTGIGLVISGITYGLELLINRFAKTRKEIDDFVNTQDVLKQSLESDADSVMELVEQYERYERTINSGKASPHVMEEHKRITEELAQLFPDLVQGNEDYGTVIEANADIMKVRIDLINQEIEAERELNRVRQQAQHSENVENAVKAQKEIDELFEKMRRRFNNPVIHLQASSDLFDTSEFEEAFGDLIEIAAPVDSFSDLHSLLVEIKRTQSEIATNENLTSEQRKQALEDLELYEEKLSKTLQRDDYTTNALKIQEGSFSLIQQSMAELEEAMSFMANPNQDFVGLFGRISNEIIKATDDINVMDNAMTKIREFATTDQFGGDFRNAIDGWSDAMKEYNEAVEDDEKFAALEKVRDYYEEILVNVEGLLYDTDLGLSATEREQVLAALEAELSAYLKLGDAKAKSIDNEIELANVLAEGTEAIDNQTEAVQSLTDALKEADKEIDTISKALEQLGELDALETDTLYDLLELYPELLGMQLDAAGLEDFLHQKREEAHQSKLDRFYDELMGSEEVMQGIIANENTKLAEILENNGIELDDFENMNELKKLIQGSFSKHTLLSQEDVLRQLGEAYGIDVDNFKDLAEAKAAIEEALMKAIVEQWNDYISQLDGTLAAYAKQFEGMEGIEELRRRGHSATMHEAGYDRLDNEGNIRFENEYKDIVALNKALEEVELGEITLKLAGIEYDPKKFASDQKEIDDLIGKSLDGAGDRARERANAKSGSSAGSSSSPSEKELRDLNIEVERQIKTFQKQTFVLDEYEESLRKINLEIEKQKLATSSYATHTRNYRRALEQEIKLNEKKLEIMQAQEKSLEQQIKSGNIQQYGMINEDINVAYNRYNTSGSGDNVASTGRVTRTANGQLSPFAGWRTSYQMGKRNLFAGESYHYGQDFVAASGTPIHTPHGGRVIRAGWGNHGEGNYVSVYNDAMDKTFTFMHMLDDLRVSVGDVIQAGTQIGRMGSTGRSTGTHLHFQVNQGMSTNNANAINPTNYLTSNSSSWLGQIGGIMANMSTGVQDYTGSTISAERAEYLNALEQAQLDAIEQRINEHNASEQKRSDIHEAQQRLDKMTMDRLNLIAEIRQQMQEIITSQIEEFDYDSDVLNYRIAKLEYDAEKLASQAGATSDSAIWRKHMEQAMIERAKQTAFKQEQIDYIQKILSDDASASEAERMSERSRFELEDTLRQAREELIGLQRTEDDALTSILESRTNEHMTALEDALRDLDRKLQSIETKRRYIDDTYEDGAQEYRNTLREEISLNQTRAEQMTKHLESLRTLRKDLKEQPTLYREVTDKIHEMEDALEDTHATMFELNKEIARNELDKMVEGLTTRLDEAQEVFNELQHMLHFVDSDLQQDIYFNLQSDVLTEMDNYKKAIIDNINLLEAMEKEVKQYPELHKQVTDEIKNWQEEYKNVNREMHTQRKQFTDAFISSIKNVYQTQQDLAIQSIDKEYSEFEKMINKKLELIDKQYEEDTYSEDISDKQSELVALRAEIAQRMGDDSLQNQARLKELRENLADQEDEYNKFIADKERERRKEALQQELEDARDNADDRKETVTQLFEDLLNDQRQFNEIQEELMQGQVDRYKDMYSSLTDFVRQNTEEIGRSLSEGLLDSLTAPFEALLGLSDLLEKASQEDVIVPISGSRPTEPNTGSTLIDFIRGTSNNFNQSGLGHLLNSSIIDTSAPAGASNTTHNEIASILNIENFNGTKREKDTLLDSIVTELRKKGVLI